MKNTRTGHTLADAKNPATLEPMVFPDPVISVAIRPKDKAGNEKMGVALNKMVQEDPSFQVATDEESGETLIKGMGELHLDIKVDILRRTHKVDVEMGKPQVAYRETITQTVEDSYTHKKQSGGSGQYGKIDYRIEPAETNAGYEFESLVTGGNVPREYWGAIQKAFEVSMSEGTLAGYPLLDVKFSLLDGGFHAVDSSALAFEIATKAAYRQSVPKASPQLMEPIMKVDVFSPEDNVGDVIGDLNRRRGMIKAQEAGVTGVRVKADAPLAEMFGYIGHLRTLTSGRGQFSMEFSHYSLRGTGRFHSGLGGVESCPVLRHPPRSFFFALLRVFHDVGMSVHVMRCKRLHPVFEGLSLGFVFAQIAFQSLHGIPRLLITG
jgi:elongation factor G